MDLIVTISSLTFGFVMLALYLVSEAWHKRTQRELIQDIRRMARLVKAKTSMDENIMEEVDSPSPMVFVERNNLSENDLQAFHDRSFENKLDKNDRSTLRRPG